MAVAWLALAIFGFAQAPSSAPWASSVAMAATPAQGAIGEAAVEIPDGTMNGESSLGNFVTDAMRQASGASIAFLPSNVMTGKIAQGPIFPDDLNRILLYPDDSLVTMRLQGSAIMEILTRSVSLYPRENGGFLQVSGIRFSFVATQPPQIQEILVDGIRLKPEGSYSVVVPQSLAQGFLGYNVFRKGEGRTVLSISIREALRVTVEARKVIQSHREGRIRTVQ